MGNVLGGAGVRHGVDRGWTNGCITSGARFPEVKVHLYGKGFRPGRKLGHVNVLGADLSALRRRASSPPPGSATGSGRTAIRCIPTGIAGDPAGDSFPRGTSRAASGSRRGLAEGGAGFSIAALVGRRPGSTDRVPRMATADATQVATVR